MTTALERKVSAPLSPATSAANPWNEMEHNGPPYAASSSSLTDELAWRSIPQVLHVHLFRSDSPVHPEVEHIPELHLLQVRAPLALEPAS